RQIDAADFRADRRRDRHDLQPGCGGGAVHPRIQAAAAALGKPNFRPPAAHRRPARRIGPRHPLDLY
ncbi:MAG: hypothetical protein OXF89_07100, partial [Rhodospirillaceae bacterium]|nr:hypothetical protein [Rhodospirillaceae bacterium]